MSGFLTMNHTKLARENQESSSTRAASGPASGPNADAPARGNQSTVVVDHVAEQNYDGNGGVKGNGSKSNSIKVSGENALFNISVSIEKVEKMEQAVSC